MSEGKSGSRSLDVESLLRGGGWFVNGTARTTWSVALSSNNDGRGFENSGAGHWARV
jgi:hypothetical protein